MSESTPRQTTLTSRLLSFLIVAASYRLQVDAFVASPMARPAIATTNARVQPLFVGVADPPGREEKEKRRYGDDDGNAWVETSDGGFLPKIPQIFKEKLAPAKRKKEASAPTQVVTIQEYKAVVADEKDQMVCVRFYAPWCKACKAVQQPFRKLCRDNPGVKFVEVPLTKENAFLHEGLGIPSLPYGHIYHPEAGLVEELKMKKKDGEFANFAKVLETYVRGECEVEYPDTGVCQQNSS